MAMAYLNRALIAKPVLPSIICRSFTAKSLSVPNFPFVSRSSFLRFRPLISLTEFHRFPSMGGVRCLSTRPTTSSLNDPSPNWNNRPPKETILLDGCDFEHWLIVLEKPEGEPTRDEIIDSYIKTLATVVGSEDAARKSIYSVSTRHYYAFGCIVSEEISYKIKELPRVRWVLPDSYLDVKNKDYGGEPFIDGQAVPYDPKYHEEWVRNNARANERSRRNDRPRNFDRSRNFERRRENMQSRDAPPMPNRGMPNTPPNMGGMPPNPNVQSPVQNMGSVPPNPNVQNTTPYMGGMPPNANYQNPAQNMGGMPPNANYQNPAQNMGGMPPNPNMQNMPNMGGMPSRDVGPNAGYSNNMNMGGGMPQRDAGPNAGYSNGMPNGGNIPNRDFQYRDAPNSGGMPYQSREGPGPGPMPNRDYQNNYMPNRNMGDMPSGNAYQVRDMPGRDMPPPPTNPDYQ